MVYESTSFTRQHDCVYEGESYSVRDNGTVYRHERPGKRSRPADGQWTFGKPNENTGYMELASVRVHRIVATAFLGPPPTPQHIVDHVDTNRRNNRPENLRWVTRLENVLLNPVTAKRIALLYGSVEAFLEDPKRSPINGGLGKNFEWMRTVSRDEARVSYERLLHWAMSDHPTSGGSLGPWLFSRAPEHRSPEEPLRDLLPSKTPQAAQRKWRIASEFPACPGVGGPDPLKTYATKLTKGTIFAQDERKKSIVYEVALSDEGRSLWVMCELSEDSENIMKPWALARVTYESGLFVHTSEGTFFEKDGAEKYFALGRGLDWTGGEVFDDFC